MHICGVINQLLYSYILRSNCLNRRVENKFIPSWMWGISAMLENLHKNSFDFHESHTDSKEYESFWHWWIIFSRVPQLEVLLIFIEMSLKMMKFALLSVISIRRGFRRLIIFMKPWLLLKCSFETLLDSKESKLWSENNINHNSFELNWNIGLQQMIMNINTEFSIYIYKNKLF